MTGGNPTWLAFIDTETTSLDPWRRKVWEVAVILRRPGGNANTDVQRHFFIRTDDLNLADADPLSLHIGRFYERHPNPYGRTVGVAGMAGVDSVASILAEELRGAVLIGANVWFDAAGLSQIMRDGALAPECWDYHLVDITAYAAGVLRGKMGAPPWSFAAAQAACGVTLAAEDRHTALGDARAVRDCWDALNRIRQE